MALAVPLSRFTSRVGGGSAFFVRHCGHMNISQHFKFSRRGFSPHRMAYLLDFVSLAVSPLHFFASCDNSGRIYGFALLVCLAVLVLCILSPRGTSHRFLPFGLGLLITLHHGMSAH